MFPSFIGLGLNSMLEWVVGGYVRPVGAECGAVDLFHIFSTPRASFSRSNFFFSSFDSSIAEVDGCDSRLVHTRSADLYLLKPSQSAIGYCPVRLCTASSRIFPHSSAIHFALLNILFSLRSQPSFYFKKINKSLGRFFNLFNKILYYSGLVLFLLFF